MSNFQKRKHADLITNSQWTLHSLGIDETGSVPFTAYCDKSLVTIMKGDKDYLSMGLREFLILSDIFREYYGDGDE